MPILETRDLEKHYQMGRQQVLALNGVTFRVDAGEFICIMGRSGSGKSTLLNLVGCLDRPTSGAVFHNGLEVSRSQRGELSKIRRDNVGFVFQQFNLIATLTAIENVMLPLKYAGVRGDGARQRAAELLEAVEMSHRLSHRPVELSGGEKQRVAIARALVNGPAVVLADEPTGEVDTETAMSIIGLMRHLNDVLGQTFLVVSHDPIVSDHARRIIRLKDGRIESDTG